MTCFSFISALFGILGLIAGTTIAGPVRQADDFLFKSWLNRDDCPMAGGTKYDVLGKTFGILCGWDTKARTYHWGPYTGLDFSECIQKCAAKPECSLATYTGTCYLKKSAKGMGYVHTGRASDMTAIKLHKTHDHKEDGHKKDG